MIFLCKKKFCKNICRLIFGCDWVVTKKYVRIMSECNWSDLKICRSSPKNGWTLNCIYYIQVPSCRGSRLFTAFSEHVLHRLAIHPETEKVTTFLKISQNLQWSSLLLYIKTHDFFCQFTLHHTSQFLRKKKEVFVVKKAICVDFFPLMGFWMMKTLASFTSHYLTGLPGEVSFG